MIEFGSPGAPCAKYVPKFSNIYRPAPSRMGTVAYQKNIMRCFVVVCFIHFILGDTMYDLGLTGFKNYLDTVVM